ncbi:hypothetical protein A2397_05115 [Candidatus Amesbacteria bacterium RIFOXYB1_FULL_44_23]|uniref:Glycosyl transferase family 1 domain-containing protein n=1 Tax=Candidatus Amesbacteria bacterium RIFOXYB1_FULL_44_23 TaxID=1797263 RepID=A0A1F4ZU18_9BACT|nr:MAG: hypothetical protein A2397_05115 [Candidatus Amesbacteria bacterium RIFOXYB1_FULL_44_23]
MKILLVTQTYLDSYPPRNLSMASAVKQANQLSKRHQVLVLTSGRKLSKDTPSPNLTILSVPGILIPDPVNYALCPRLLLEFINQVKSYQPDVIMVSKFMFFSSLVIPIARIMHQKVITTTDTFPGINWFPRSKLVGAIMWLYARIIGLPLLWLSHVVILLYPGLEPIAKRYRLNYQTIPNGVEPALLHKLPPPADLRKPKNEYWVGFVGRAESVKGYDIAVDAARLLVTHPHIKFVFIGGNQKETSQKNTIFLGFRHDIYNIYQLLDCLIVPSISEGLPNVVMEAMAQGVPVVSRKIGGIAYLVEPGKTGIFVDCNSANEYAQAIINLYQDLNFSARLSKNSQNFIRQNHNWSRIINLYEDLIKNL